VFVSWITQKAITDFGEILLRHINHIIRPTPRRKWSDFGNDPGPKSFVDSLPLEVTLCSVCRQVMNGFSSNFTDGWRVAHGATTRSDPVYGHDPGSFIRIR